MTLRDRLEERDLLEPAKKAARANGVTIEEMFSARKFANVVRARTDFAVYLKNELGWGYAAIGRLYGQDHTSARRAIKLRLAAGGEG